MVHVWSSKPTRPAKTTSQTASATKGEGKRTRSRFWQNKKIGVILLILIPFEYNYNSKSWEWLEETPMQNNGARNNLESLYVPTFPPNASFFEPCQEQVHTFEIQEGKVKWASPTVYSYMNRGPSMHCLLARSAQRQPHLSVKLRIGIADVHPLQPLTFGPAARQDEVLSSKPPLLFPDSTFESFPEVHDFSLKETFQAVQAAAVQYGLPGSNQWLERDPQLFWRGSHYGKERLELIQHKSSLLNVESIQYNMTLEKGFHLSSKNKVTRSDHCRYRFLLHMNGEFNNRYSSALKWKLLCGSLVFLPNNPLYVEWWNFKTMQPNTHYVAFSDTAELLHKVQYYQRHLQEASRIARRGMEFVKQAAFERLEQFMDETLQRYAQFAHRLPQETCHNKKYDRNMSAEFKTLEELTKEYGQKICI
jgi:hypothetical protein